MPRLQRIAFGKDTEITSGSRSPTTDQGGSSPSQRPRSKSEPMREEIRRKPVTTPGVSAQSTPDLTDDDEFIDDDDEDEVIEGDDVVPNNSGDGYMVPNASGRSGSLISTNSLRQLQSSVVSCSSTSHHAVSRTSSFTMYNNNNTNNLDMFGASPSNNSNASPALTAKQQQSVQFGTTQPMVGPATINLIDDFPIRPSQSQPTSSNPCM